MKPPGHRHRPGGGPVLRPMAQLIRCSLARLDLVCGVTKEAIRSRGNPAVMCTVRVLDELRLPPGPVGRLSDNTDGEPSMARNSVPRPRSPMWMEASCETSVRPFAMMSLEGLAVSPSTPASRIKDDPARSKHDPLSAMSRVDKLRPTAIAVSFFIANVVRSLAQLCKFHTRGHAVCLAPVVNDLASTIKRNGLHLRFGGAPSVHL